MPLGCPSVGRTSYTRIKLQKETHILWIEIKRSLGLKSDDALPCRLLNTTVTVSNRRNFTEVNDLNQSHNLVLETGDTSKMMIRWVLAFSDCTVDDGIYFSVPYSPLPSSRLPLTSTPISTYHALRQGLSNSIVTSYDDVAVNRCK